MNPRNPLTFRWPRSVAETRRDPYAWWEGPHEPTHGLVIELDNSPFAQIARWFGRVWLAINLSKR